MDAEINNVIYMELNSGPKIANSTCGKTIDVETIDRDSTVYIYIPTASISVHLAISLIFKYRMSTKSCSCYHAVNV